jgi:hypothetical protein
LSTQRKDKLAQALLNHKVQTIPSGDGSVITDPDLEEILGIWSISYMFLILILLISSDWTGVLEDLALLQINIDSFL